MSAEPTPRLVAQLHEAVEANSDDDGWAPLVASVGPLRNPAAPGVRPRTYSFTKLSDLMTATTLFEVERRRSGGGKPDVVFARDASRRTTTQPAHPSARRRGDGDSQADVL